MDNRVIPAILGVMALIFVGLGVLIYLQFRPEQEIRYESDGDTEFAASAIDSGARIEIEVLRSQIEALTEAVQNLEKEIGRVEFSSRGPTNTAPVEGNEPVFQSDGTNDIIDSYAQVVLIAGRRDLNKGLKIASPSYLESVFGKPRDVLTSECQGMTNTRLASKLKTEQVGPVRVRMLTPAIESLGRVFDKIKATDPDLYARINTAGALCVRHIRGAPGRTSTHAFGLSLDLNIDGKLDRLGDGKTQLGLTILADFFRNEGWYWGAGFSREDSMHFEVSRGLVERWIEEGKL
ncbi:M15 family metallopeptidase [uncultured Tateyamaria sp.]|uniref:M15 family metallopeptidase n=1 Tax=uncultured Tateyamaria sp. TaxID=455651 RepID=UPI0026255938|nr:M15 family metallopeptidase [uncultured Tateyamaria sp.]